jgi:hypothetical protein
MDTLKNKPMFRMILGRTMAWGALATCLSATPLRAQNQIDGKFTLRENARFGDTLLGAGQYKFSIGPVGIVHSIRSIQEGAGHLVLVVLRPEKAGPVVSIFAMASVSKRASEINELILEPEKTGNLAGTMYLEREGLMVNFRWAEPKGKNPVVAEQAVPVETAALTRFRGN